MAIPRRTLRWTILAGALLAAIWGVYWLIQRLVSAGPDVAANRLVLPTLVIAIVVLALALAGVLIRNLVRLILERRRGVLGSKLRTKLVFFFLALVLLPALVLSYGAAAVIRMTVEAIVRTPVEDLTRNAREIADRWKEDMRDHCGRAAMRTAEAIDASGVLAPEHAAGLAPLVAAWRDREGVDLLVVETVGGRAASATSAGFWAHDVPLGDALALTAALARRVESSRRPVTDAVAVGGGVLVLGGVPVGRSDTAGPGRSSGVVVASSFLSRNLAARMAQIASGSEAYRSFRLQRRDLIRLYTALIVLVFLATVFVATWIGFRLSRRITGPIQELAAAAREISAGNLAVRVGAEAGDEVGMLVVAFNEMAAQLQESREVITRSTADLRRSNQALDERRRYIETLVENLATAVVSVDGEGRVSLANSATEAVLGVRLEPGEDLRGRLRDRQMGALGDLLDHPAARFGDGLRRDLSLTRDGEARAVSAQLRPLRGDRGQRLGVLLMVEDLTDLLRAQRAAAWKEVARRIAHEIKNPLTPIRLSAQRLRKKFEEDSADLADVLPEATAAIEREVSALKQLVDEFSGFARMPEVVPGPTDFGAMVGSVVALYHGLPGVRFEVVLDPALGPVNLDAEQMRRAMINLVDNAVAAMGGEGLIRIVAHPHAGPGSLHVEIGDSGPGISPTDRDKLFLPYFSTKKRGTGLGLAIVHRVVTDHGGTIRAEDNRPGGARFVIEIPG